MEELDMPLSIPTMLRVTLTTSLVEVLVGSQIISKDTFIRYIYYAFIITL